LNNVAFSGLLSIGLGIAVMLEATELVEVMLSELVELVGLMVVELESTSLPSVMPGLGLGLRLGIAAEVPVVVGPSSLLTPTKRVAAAMSRQRQRHSNAFAREACSSNMTPGWSRAPAARQGDSWSIAGRKAALADR
jgi:hypothetical protein